MEQVEQDYRVNYIVQSECGDWLDAVKPHAIRRKHTYNVIVDDRGVVMATYEAVSQLQIRYGIPHVIIPFMEVVHVMQGCIDWAYGDREEALKGENK